MLLQTPGLANRTAEKVKPSALDLLLLFKESVRLKESIPGAKKTALRDVLFSSIADYNKSIGNHRAPCHKSCWQEKNVIAFQAAQLTVIKYYAWKCAICSKGWRVNDSTRRLIYNLLRSPKGLWTALKLCYNETKPELAGQKF